MNKISVIGAGGHTRSSINLLKNYFSTIDIEIYDNSYNKERHECIGDFQLVGKVSALEKNSMIFLSIGDCTLRNQYFDMYEEQILKDNLFHKTSFKEDKIKIGIANQVYAMAYINSYVKIGNDNIINSGVIIEHEASIGSHNHISVGAVICGRVKLGDRCFIGAGSVINDSLTICNDVVVGANSTVINDIDEPGVYVGCPVRKVK